MPLPPTHAPRTAEGIHAKYPGKMLAYNCSPSFNWEKNLSKEQIATFQQELGKMGYKFQFVTLAGGPRASQWKPVREQRREFRPARAARLPAGAAPHRLLWAPAASCAA